jgi:hypothetical protein
MSNQQEILKIESWCFRNNCLIYPHPIDNNFVIIRISYKGKVIDGTILYKTRIKDLKKGDLNWTEAIRKLQKQYYDNYNK